MKQDESTIKQEDSIPEDSFLPNEREGEFFYRFEAKSHLLNAKQYIYYLGPYRYNWHYDIEIMLVLEGKIEVNYGGKTVFLEQDDLLILTPNEGHATLAKSTSSKAMLLRVNPDYLKDYYAPIRNYYFSGNTDEKNRNQLKFVLIRGILANMISHIGSKDPLVRLKFESELNHLLSLLFDAFPPKAKNSASDEKKIRKDDELIRKIVRYIESHYQEKISLSDLGRLCSYNLSYLSLFFKKHVGINFYEYLMRIRLREATLELCTSNENVIEIASKHGFPDLKSFNYNFKKHSINPQENTGSSCWRKTRGWIFWKSANLFPSRISRSRKNCRNTGIGWNAPCMLRTRQRISLTWTPSCIRSSDTPNS